MNPLDVRETGGVRRFERRRFVLAAAFIPALIGGAIVGLLVWWAGR